MKHLRTRLLTEKDPWVLNPRGPVPHELLDPIRIGRALGSGYGENRQQEYGSPLHPTHEGKCPGRFQGTSPPPMEILDNQASTPGTKKSGRVNALPLTAYPSLGSCLFDSI
ncbi:hypothetical protein [Synechococcus sp. Cu2B8-bc1011]|uniref:hypothetical protein n=1 Tax=Synechococcus sp. Cu2B8-bc1011 TaxID=3093725 RepID=UPI0039AFF8B5